MSKQGKYRRFLDKVNIQRLKSGQTPLPAERAEELYRRSRSELAIDRKRRKLGLLDGHGYNLRQEVLRRNGFASYREYLASPLWAHIRTSVLEREDGICQVCGCTATTVHHLSYGDVSIRGDRLDQLVAVCSGCHLRLEFWKDKKLTFPQAQRRTLAQIRARKNYVRSAQSREPKQREYGPRAVQCSTKGKKLMLYPTKKVAEAFRTMRRRMNKASKEVQVSYRHLEGNSPDLIREVSWECCRSFLCGNTPPDLAEVMADTIVDNYEIFGPDGEPLAFYFIPYPKTMWEIDTSTGKVGFFSWKKVNYHRLVFLDDQQEVPRGQVNFVRSRKNHFFLVEA